jgi:hypothetical protein
LNALMVASVIIWDIETIPDIKSFAAANGHDGKSDDEVRDELGDKFPKHIYHSMLVGHLSGGSLTQLTCRVAGISRRAVTLFAR